MLIAVLRHLKRGRQIKDLLPALDRDHAPGRETAPVARTIHIKNDRNSGVSRPDEIAVQRVTDPILDRLMGREQRLSDHLTAIDPLPRFFVCRGATEQIDLKPFKLERFDQSLGVHPRSNRAANAKFGRYPIPAH